jgi:chorismate dehydratase
VRAGALEETGMPAAELVQDLQASRDHGLSHIEDLVTEWSARIAVPAATIRFYLTNNIYYLLDENCLRGLEMFYRYAAECGALPPAPAWNML